MNPTTSVLAECVRSSNPDEVLEKLASVQPVSQETADAMMQVADLVEGNR